MNTRSLRVLLLIGLLCLPCLAAAEAPSGYYRFPTVHGGLVVFTAEGDL